MNPATVALIIQLVQIAIQYSPELVAEGTLVIELLRSGKDPTAEEQAQIDAALDKAHAALQAAVAARTAPPARPDESDPHSHARAALYGAGAGFLRFRAGHGAPCYNHHPMAQHVSNLDIFRTANS